MPSMVEGTAEAQVGWGQLRVAEPATNTWHRQGTQKTNIAYNQPKRPSIGTTQRPSNGHHRKSSPRIESQNPIPHRIVPRSSSRRSSVIARVLSANAAQCTGGPGPDSAQTRHTTSMATNSAPYTRLITTSALALQSQHRNANPAPAR